jgi:hypothetical protein
MECDTVFEIYIVFVPDYQLKHAQRGTDVEMSGKSCSFDDNQTREPLSEIGNNRLCKESAASPKELRLRLRV